MIALTVLAVLGASGERADYATLCATPIEKVDREVANGLGPETQRLVSTLFAVPDDQQGSLLRVAVRPLGVTTCALADALDTRAGTDPTTGCRSRSDICEPAVFDARFARAFEARPDRATRLVVVRVLTDDQFTVPKGLKSVTRLSVMASKGKVDLAALAPLTGLTDFSLGSAAVQTLAPLGKHTRLTKLSLTTVTLSGPLDLEFVTGLGALRELEISTAGVTPTTSLSPLSALTNLEVLKLVGVATDDYAPLAKLVNLRHLTPPGRAKTIASGDASFVAGLVKLEVLALGRWSLTDLTPLKSLTRLQTLMLSGNTQLADLSPLSTLTELQWLDLDSTAVADLAPLAGLTRLSTLTLTNCPVADLTPLSSLPALWQLSLRGTRVASLKPLYGLKKLRTITFPRDIGDEERAALKAVIPHLIVQR